MKKDLLNLYRLIFLRSNLYRLNLHLYKLSLRGIGILNSENLEYSGEVHFYKTIAEKLRIKTIFDVGANDGAISLLMREHFPDASIYAFEPHPRTYGLLKKTTEDKDIKIFNIGFTDKIGKVRLWDLSKNDRIKNKIPHSPLATLHKEVITESYRQSTTSFEVKISTIDNFALAYKIKTIDLLHLDTEGSEYSILVGAQKMLRENRIKVIMFEFNEMNVYSRVFFRDFVKLLPNYRFVRLIPGGFIDLRDYKPITHEIFAYQNIAAFNHKVINNLSF